MKTNTFLSALLLSGLMLSIPVAQADSVAVKMADLPAVVQKAVQTHVGKRKVDAIEKVTEGRDVTYEVTIGRGERERTLTFDEKGKLISKEMFLNELPAAVQEAIKKYSAGGEVDDIEKILDEDEVTYDVDFTLNQKERSFTVDEKGKLTEYQVFLPETPEPVRKAVREMLADGGKLGDINKEFDEDGMTYDVEINPGTKAAHTVSIDEAGKVVSDEEDITLAEAPGAVQAAVKERFKDELLDSVTKVTEGGTVSYDVDVTRGDKTETVTFGADGKVIE